MAKKYGTFTSDFISAVGEATGFFSWPPEGSPDWINKQYRSKKSYFETCYRTVRTGYVKKIYKNGKAFLELTSKGQLEYLINKAVMKKPKTWDHCWRIIIFDIPEDSHKQRDKLRQLLKRNNFIKLQESVFINPYPLNREAIDYLKKTGLITYIRIIRANEIDDDQDLKRKFKLTR